MAASHPASIGRRALPAGSDRVRAVFRRLSVVAVLMVVVAAVDLVGALVGGSPVPAAVGFVVALALLAVVLELGVVLFTTGERDEHHG
jgi:hypothetical protein